MFSFLPHLVGCFQSFHAITFPLPTSARMNDHILFLILSRGQLLPDLCLLCLPAKLQQMSYCVKDDAASLHMISEGSYVLGFWVCFVS